MPILKRVLPEIFVLLLFIVVHSYKLGHDNFNTDVWKWKARSYDFGTGVFTFQLEKTLQKYHPGVPLMWLGASGVKVVNILFDVWGPLSATDQIFLLDTVQKYLLVIFNGIGLVFIHYALKKMFGLKIALSAIVLMIFEPFYFALTQVFHLEGIIATYSVASVIWLYYHFHSDAKSSFAFILSAFFAAIAILTKTSSVILVLTEWVLINMYSGRVFDKNYFRRALYWSLIVLISCLVMWPALWYMPVQTITALYKGIFVVGIENEHIQYYFGKLVENPGSLYYLVVFALRSSVLLFISSLILPFIYKKLHAKNKNFINALLIFGGLYLLEITIPGKKLDRYILPLISTLSIVSVFVLSYFYQRFTDLAKSKPFINYGSYLMVLLIPMFITLWGIKPDYLSYYNPLFGGLRTGIKVLEPKWLIGTPQIMSYFKDVMVSQGYNYSTDSDSFEEIIQTGRQSQTLSVGFPEKYYTQIWPFFRNMGAWAVIYDLRPFAINTEYFVFPVWEDRAFAQDHLKLTYHGSISVRGVTMYRVYERVY